MKNEYIYERKGKNGLTLQIKVPYRSGKNRTFRTKSLKVADYQSKAAAMYDARRIRDSFLVDARISENPKKNTVAELYSMYWSTCQNSLSTKRKADTVYAEAVADLEDKTIDDISAYDLQTILSQYSQTHSDEMVAYAKNIWRQIFHTAQMQGINVPDRTEMLFPIHSRALKKGRKRQQISEDQFLEFSAALLDRTGKQEKTVKIDQDIYFLIWIMYYTGCRPSEVLAITADDIDIKSGVLHINKSIGSTRNDSRQFVTTKRPASVRDFPIYPDLQALLLRLLTYSDTTPLLCDADGLPYDINRITARITTIRRKTGIEFNLYQLRHSFSDRLFANSVNPVVIRDLMGHASSTMSLDYAKATPEQLAGAITKKSGTK